MEDPFLPALLGRYLAPGTDHVQNADNHDPHDMAFDGAYQKGRERRGNKQTHELLSLCISVPHPLTIIPLCPHVHSQTTSLKA